MRERLPRIRTTDRAPAQPAAFVPLSARAWASAQPAPPRLIDEPAPCTDCWHAERCAAGRLACIAFEMFMEGARPDRWQLVKRDPTRELYEAVLGED